MIIAVLCLALVLTNATASKKHHQDHVVMVFSRPTSQLQAMDDVDDNQHHIMLCMHETDDEHRRANAHEPSANGETKSKQSITKTTYRPTDG